jgi:hypothetical protein
MRVPTRLLLVLSTVVIAAVTPEFLFSQQVVLPGQHPDPNFCNNVEHIKPNLQVSTPARISGRVVDQAGAPLKLSKVELRTYISEKQQIPVKTVTTDEDGRFDLGSVGPGKYRLLPSLMRVYEPPQHISCTSGECTLALNLRFNPTDQPISICPVR